MLFWIYKHMIWPSRLSVIFLFIMDIRFVMTFILIWLILNILVDERKMTKKRWSVLKRFDVSVVEFGEKKHQNVNIKGTTCKSKTPFKTQNISNKVCFESAYSGENQIIVLEFKRILKFDHIFPSNICPSIRKLSQMVKFRDRALSAKILKVSFI